MKHYAILAAAILSAIACAGNEVEAPGSPVAATGARTVTSRSDEPRRVPVTVTGSGYEPAAVEAHAGERLTLVFKRTSDEGCGHQLVFPGRDIRRDLPLNEEIEVELIPQEKETIGFTCGMGMYRGSVVALAR